MPAGRLEVVKIDHCSVVITDVERGRRFYRDVLGLREIPKPRTFDFEVVWFDLGDQHLHLLRKEQPDTLGPRHFALRVADAAAARAYFQAHDVAVRETTPIPGADRFFIADPDGNRIEIIQWLVPYSDTMKKKKVEAEGRGMKTKWLLGGVVLLVLAGVAFGAYWYGPFRRRAEELRLPGVVEVQEVRLGSKVGGRVAKVMVEEGQVVEAGAPLVYFEVPELEAQREQWLSRLRAAEAELERARNGPRREEKDAAKAAVDAATARWQRLKVGWRVEEVRQAKSELASAEADAKVAREDYERVDRLFRQGSLSRADFDSARAARDRAAGRGSAARARLDMLEAGSRAEDVAEAAAELARARANYDLLLAGTRSEDFAAAEARAGEARGKLAEIDANLQEGVVRAPERVALEVVGVRKGDLVAPNQPILRALRAADLWVKVYVPETELGMVREGQEVVVTVDSYPGRRFAGTVTQIANISEFTPRNVQSVDERRHQVFGLKVRVADPEGVFKSGMAAEVTVPLQ